MMNRFAPALVLGALFALSASAQSMTPDQMLDEAIAHESTLLSVLQARTPVAETYIQEQDKCDHLDWPLKHFHQCPMQSGPRSFGYPFEPDTRDEIKCF